MARGRDRAGHCRPEHPSRRFLGSGIRAHRLLALLSPVRICLRRAEGPVRRGRWSMAHAVVRGWTDHDGGPQADAEERARSAHRAIEIREKRRRVLSSRPAWVTSVCGRRPRSSPTPTTASDPANRVHRRYRLQYRCAVPDRIPGVAEYYRLAFNRHRLSRLKYVMERSLVKTLARKYRATSGQAHRRDRPCWPLSTGPAAGCGSPCTATARCHWCAGCHASTPQRRFPAHLERPVRTSPTAPGQPLRHVPDRWAGQGAPHPCPQ